MKYLLLFLPMFLFSCGLSHESVADAEKVCKQNEGVAYTRVYFVSHEVHCNNGAVFALRKISIGGKK
jgi:hypothetical protein